MVDKDYIDITPKGVDKEGKGQAGKKTTAFQESEWDQIINNPERLTKEGIEKKIELWQKSVNRHCQLKYETMKARCKFVADSGKTTDNAIIFSRNPDGSPNWTDIPPSEIKSKIEKK